MSAVGSYHFLVNVSHDNDLIPGNNDLDQTVEVFTPPLVYLGTDTVVHTKTHVLDAGAGFISYLWQDGSTSQFYIIAKEGGSWVYG